MPLVLLDIRMPGMDGLELLELIVKDYPTLPVVMMSGHGTMDTAISALRLGAFDFLTKPIDLNQLITTIRGVVETRKLQARHLILPADDSLIKTAGLVGNGPGDGIVGESEWVQKVRRQVRLIAEARCDTVLINGETGTGKEVVARAIHEASNRDNGLFVAVSCPALPDSLVESELFGHVKGAFTGASEERTGCFEMAHNGTLFLDEIGDLSLSAQAKLLRALETRSVRRVGGTTEVGVNARIVAATNVPLLEAVNSGTFRSDLFYRLNLFCVETCPLRERRQDILPLARYFLRRFADVRGLPYPGIAPEVESVLQRQHFAGNVRELKNVIERAVILSGGQQITMEYLTLDAGSDTARDIFTVHGAEEFPAGERERIAAALEKVQWNRRKAALLLEMPYSTLRYKIEKLGIG